MIEWHTLSPEEAVGINLTVRLDITAPLNEEGERCPWPWEPMRLSGAPLGQFHCPHCGAMCVAGVPHLDYTPEQFTLNEDNVEEVIAKHGGERDGETVFLPSPWGPVAFQMGNTILIDGYGVPAKVQEDL